MIRDAVVHIFLTVQHSGMFAVEAAKSRRSASLLTFVSAVARSGEFLKIPAWFHIVSFRSFLTAAGLIAPSKKSSSILSSVSIHASSILPLRSCDFPANSPARFPKTWVSASAFPPRRFAPCTPPATSPQAKSRGMVVRHSGVIRRPPMMWWAVGATSIGSLLISTPKARNCSSITGSRVSICSAGRCVTSR